MSGRATSPGAGFDVLARRCPRVAATVAVTVAVWVSLAPSLLPRPALAQAAVSGCAAAAAAGAAGLCRRRNAGSTRPAARLVALLAAAVALGWTVLAAAQWQDGLRAAMGRPPTWTGHWIVVCVCSSCILGATRVLGRVPEAWRRRADGRAGRAAAAAVTLGAVVAV
ncbi:MAG: hypothetical protein LOY04_06165, partial [Rhodococcus ruber]|nr:hypothetical protein [Rhodococcus ruber]